MKRNEVKIKMDKKMKIVFYFAIAMIAIAALLYVADKVVKENSNGSNYKQNYCTPESRKAEVCIALYEPVCGWFNESIKCVRYPCAATYSNKCFACQDPKVEYWTEGECPK